VQLPQPWPMLTASLCPVQSLFQVMGSVLESRLTHSLPRLKTADPRAVLARAA